MTTPAGASHRRSRRARFGISPPSPDRPTPRRAARQVTRPPAPQRRRRQDGHMDLPVMPPVPPMLAKSVASIPGGAMSYEPKWDGFRSVIFRDGDEVEIGSRNERPMTRYFPEIVAAVRENLPKRSV